METEHLCKPFPILTTDNGMKIVPPVLVPGKIPELKPEDIELLHEYPPVAFRAEPADDGHPKNDTDQSE